MIMMPFITPKQNTAVVLFFYINMICRWKLIKYQHIDITYC